MVSIALIAITSNSNNFQMYILVYIGLQVFDAIGIYRIRVELSTSTEVDRFLAGVY